MVTAFELLESETPLLIIAPTASVVGVRSVMLSLSIAPHFDRLATRWKWFLAYFLWTPVYALSIEQFDADPTSSRRGHWLGAAIPLWVTVGMALIAGIVSGAGVPAAWQLPFVVPLAFIAPSRRFLIDRATKAAALGAGVLAVQSGLDVGSDHS